MVCREFCHCFLHARVCLLSCHSRLQTRHHARDRCQQCGDWLHYHNERMRRGCSLLSKELRGHKVMLIELAIVVYSGLSLSVRTKAMMKTKCFGKSYYGVYFCHRMAPFVRSLLVIPSSNADWTWSGTRQPAGRHVQTEEALFRFGNIMPSFTPCTFHLPLASGVRGCDVTTSPC